MPDRLPARARAALPAGPSWGRGTVRWRVTGCTATVGPRRSLVDVARARARRATRTCPREGHRGGAVTRTRMSLGRTATWHPTGHPSSDTSTGGAAAHGRPHRARRPPVVPDRTGKGARQEEGAGCARQSVAPNAGARTDPPPSACSGRRRLSSAQASRIARARVFFDRQVQALTGGCSTSPPARAASGSEEAGGGSVTVEPAAAPARCGWRPIGGQRCPAWHSREVHRLGASIDRKWNEDVPGALDRAAILSVADGGCLLLVDIPVCWRRDSEKAVETWP